jgi:hypothetical protein
MEYKELDRQLEIRMDSSEAEYVGAKIGGTLRAYSLGKIEAYKDIRGLIKDFPSLVKEEDEGDIDSDREMQRERNFDRVQQSIETGGTDY